MEFALLGPLEVTHLGAPVPLGPRRAERCLLGLLLLEAGRPIPTDRLADLLWDGAPPPNAKLMLRSHLSRLRSRFDPERDGALGVRFLATGQAYSAQLDPESVDTQRFRRAVAASSGLAAVVRAPVLRETLDLWRGPLLADVASDLLRDRIGTELAELRWQAYEEYFETCLELGRHREIIAELMELVAAQPFRERLVRALMQALHRDGRAAQALEVLSLVRQETGLDFAGDLQLSILQGESPAQERNQLGPRQLPPDVAHFVGRSDLLHDILSTTAPTVALHGPGGIGKSALAIRAAQKLTERYPDGQLYLDLLGSTPCRTPLPPQEALARLLRGLGVDARRVPSGVDEAAAMFRERVAGARMLLLIDNAAGVEQVLPLLGACFTLVTSRAPIPALGPALEGGVGTLTQAESAALLGHFHPTLDTHVEEVVRLCGGLPLALRVTAARLASRPDWTVETVVSRMRDERTRLDELDQDDLSVQASIAVSHHALDGDAADLLVGIGWLDCGQIPAALAQAMAGPGARELLDRLVRQQLMQRQAADRYGMHDLVRLYARRQPPRWDSFVRAVDYYVTLSIAAARKLFPLQVRTPSHDSLTAPVVPFADADEARAWIGRELDNVVTIAQQVAMLEEPREAAIAAKIGEALFYPLFDHTYRFKELHTLGQANSVIAAVSGNARGEAMAHEIMGWAMGALGEGEAALPELDTALSMFESLSDPIGMSATLQGYGVALRALRRYDEAVERLAQAVDVCRKHGVDTLRVANLLDALGLNYRYAGRYEQAIASHEESLRIRTERNSLMGVGATHENFGNTLFACGRVAEALRHFQLSYEIACKVSYTALEASSLWGIGNVHRALGNAAGAKAAFHEAIRALLRAGAIGADEAGKLLTQDMPDTPMAWVWQD